MFVQHISILSCDLRQLYLVCYGLLDVVALWAAESTIFLELDCEGSGCVSEDMATICGLPGAR
jgi:hypothetical protein